MSREGAERVVELEVEVDWEVLLSSEPDERAESGNAAVTIAEKEARSAGTSWASSHAETSACESGCGATSAASSSLDRWAPYLLSCDRVHARG